MYKGLKETEARPGERVAIEPAARVSASSLLSGALVVMTLTPLIVARLHSTANHW